MPYLQHPKMSLDLAIRTVDSPSLYSSQVRSAIVALDPDIPSPDIRPLSYIVNETMADRRMGR